MKTQKYPRYYDIDGTIVVLELHGEYVKGFVVLTGYPYPPAKAIIDGHQITKREALQTVARLRGGQ